jgi:hypothetical protein
MYTYICIPNHIPHTYLTSFRDHKISPFFPLIKNRYYYSNKKIPLGGEVAEARGGGRLSQPQGVLPQESTV